MADCVLACQRWEGSIAAAPPKGTPLLICGLVVGFFQNRPECKEMQEILLKKANESLVPLSFLFVLQKTLDSFLEFRSLSVPGAPLGCRSLA